MSETLLQRLDRIDKELAEIKSIKPPKQIDYSEGILILENINKELTKKFADLNAKYYELNKELLVIKNKRPVEQVDYSKDISLLSKKINAFGESIVKPAPLPTVKSVKVIDHTSELSLINNEIKSIKQVVNKKQEFDIKSEVEKIVNIAYINNIYRNK